MSARIRKLIYMLCGLFGGVAVWPVMELLIQLQGSFESYLSFSLFSGALFGVVLGITFGVVDGLISGSRYRVVTGSVFGALIGGLGGGLGFLMGQGVLFFLGESFFRSGTDFNLVGRPISRAVSWAILASFVGLAEGVRARSGLKAGMGVVGGVAGGLIGGAALEYANLVLPGQFARPLGLALLGLLIAAFYTLVEGALAYGRLRLLNGPYRGKEFVLNERTCFLGSDPRSDVYLPDYPAVLRAHARIKEERGELRLYPKDEGSVEINDEAVPLEGSRPLKYDDVIRLGEAKLFYQPLR